MSTTLAALRLRCQEESDNVNQTYISNAEWLSYINASYAELYGRIVTAFGNDYFTQTPATGYTFVTSGTTQFFALPTDFFKLLGVDLQISAPNYYATLKPFSFAERNDLSISNTNIPTAGQTIRVFYVPKMTPLVADSDTVDGVNGWEELIIIDACIKALAKEESDVSVFMARKAMFEERLNGEIESRDATGASKTSDSRGKSTRAMRYRLNGNSLWLIGNGQPGWYPFGDWSSDYGYGEY